MPRNNAAPYTDPYAALGWTPAAVGCHWTRGEYNVSTYRQGTESGYVIHRNPGAYVVAHVPTWPEVERLTDRRHAERRRGTPDAPR